MFDASTSTSIGHVWTGTTQATEKGTRSFLPFSCAASPRLTRGLCLRCTRKQAFKVVNLQRRFATHVFRTNLQTRYAFESLSKPCNALQHYKYRKKSSATGFYTRKIFLATSYRCKLTSVTPPLSKALRSDESFLKGHRQDFICLSEKIIR